MAGRLDTDSLLLLHDALARLEQGFVHLPPIDTAPADPVALREVLNEVAERLRDNYPYFHPLYAGQMLKPPHPVARLAYALAMWINPNNHALDGGRASSAMEKEAVAEIARDVRLGRRTSATSRAAARWRTSRRCGSRASSSPARPSLASAQAHYTHSRISAVLGLPFESVPADGRAAWTSDALEDAARSAAASAPSSPRSARRPPAPWIRCPRSWRCASATASGCTPTAAYGGYFVLADNLAPPARAAFDRDRRGRLDRHRSAQARAAALRLRLRAVPRSRRSAASTSTTRRTPTSARPSCTSARSASSARGRARPPSRSGRRRRSCRSMRGGEFARGLADCRAAALALHAQLGADARFVAGLRARARHRRLGRARGDRRGVVGPRARASSRRPRGAVCTWRSPSCPLRSSAIPGRRAAPSRACDRSS